MSTPNLDDYIIDENGRVLGLRNARKPTLGQRARSLVRDIPAALDTVANSPGPQMVPARLATGGLGLARAAAQSTARADDLLAPMGVATRRAIRQQLGGYVTGRAVANEKLQRALATGDLDTIRRVGQVTDAFRRPAMSNASLRRTMATPRAEPPTPRWQAGLRENAAAVAQWSPVTARIVTTSHARNRRNEDE